MSRWCAEKETVTESTEKPVANGSNNSLTVETVDNHIYFYSDVDSDRGLALVKALRELDSYLREERSSRDLPVDFPYIPIWLHIASDGGDLFTGLSLADQLARIKTPVYTVVDGAACSAATLISMAGTKRYITPNSFMLIHQFSAVKWGTYEQFKDEMVLYDALIERLVKFYVGKSKLDEGIIRDALKHDTWYSAEQALEFGLVDEILE